MKFLILLFFIGFAVGIPVHAEPAGADALFQRHRDSLVVVKDKKGGGSAFIAQIGKGKYLVTNQHVVASEANPTFTLPNGKPVRVGTAAAAVDHDIMTFGVDSDVTAMETMQGVDRNVSIGDEVAVLGNPDAAGVIRPITGRVLGIGPQLVEVSAEFVPGNSGSPVVHVKSGKVIAVATYIQYYVADVSDGRTSGEVRRFATRLDSIKQWEKVIWWHYHDDYQTVEAVRKRTRDLITIASIVAQGQKVDVQTVNDRTLLRPITSFYERVRTVKTKEEGTEVATAFIKALHSASMEDIAIARRKVGYDFYKKDLEKEEERRVPVTALLDRAVKVIPQL